MSVEDEPAIDRLAAAERVDGVIAPGIDFPVAIAARVAARLGLPHPLDAATAQVATSKLRQRERLAEAGVLHARHRVCSSLSEASAAAEELGFPCVVKAPDLQGQKGLGLVPGAEALPQAFDLARGLARSSVVLVEELVAGPEVTVNGFSVGGRFHPLTVTDRVVAEPPAFGVALAHVWPSELPEETLEEVVRVAAAAAAAVGVQDGPTYTQVLVGEDGPRVGELAARLGGGHDAELCEAAVGVHLNRAGDRGRARRAALRRRLRPGRAGRRRVRPLSRPGARRAGVRRRARRGRALERRRVGAELPRARLRARRAAARRRPCRRRPGRRRLAEGGGRARAERRPKIRFVTAEAEALV